MQKHALTTRRLLIVALIVCAISIGDAAQVPESSTLCIGFAYSIIGLGALSFTLVHHSISNQWRRSADPSDAALAVQDALQALPRPYSASNGSVQSDSDDDFVPARGDDDYLAPVPLVDAQHALAAEEQCMREINRIRSGSGMDQLQMIEVLSEAQMIVSRGILYDFVVNVSDGGQFINMHMECDALHNAANMSEIAEYLVVGIPQPESVFPDAWLQLAHALQIDQAGTIPEPHHISSKLPPDKILAGDEPFVIRSFPQAPIHAHAFVQYPIRASCITDYHTHHTTPHTNCLSRTWRR
jgi:hypothetical protein